MAIELAGQRFGQLTVIEKSRSKRTQHQYWICQCDCGEKYTARGSLLLDGSTTRCLGCAHVASVANRTARGKVPVSAGAGDFAMQVYQIAAKHLASGVQEMREIMDAAHARITGV